MNIKKVGNVILAVKDLDKSIQFYNEIIGLPIKNQRRTWVDLGTSGALLSLHPASLTEQQGNALESGITVGFLVGDVKSAVDESKEIEEHTSELQSHHDLVCRLLLEKKKKKKTYIKKIKNNKLKI